MSTNTLNSGESQEESPKMCFFTILDIPSRGPHFVIGNTSHVTGEKPIAVWSQAISLDNPLVAFDDNRLWKEEVRSTASLASHLQFNISANALEIKSGTKSKVVWCAVDYTLITKQVSKIWQGYFNMQQLISSPDNGWASSPKQRATAGGRAVRNRCSVHPPFNRPSQPWWYQ
jgi:hypothetical protein